MSNVRVVVQQRRNTDIAIVRLYGALDTVAAYGFQEQLDAIIRSGKYRLIIDLNELDYISSAGIGVFSAVSRELQQYDGEIIFVQVPEKIYKLFGLVGLIPQFTITDSVEQAVEEFDGL